MDDEVLGMFVATVIAIAAMCTMTDAQAPVVPDTTVVAVLWSAQ